MVQTPEEEQQDSLCYQPPGMLGLAAGGQRLGLAGLGLVVLQTRKAERWSELWCKSLRMNTELSCGANTQGHVLGLLMVQNPRG